jgi:hypothetical protein
MHSIFHPFMKRFECVNLTSLVRIGESSRVGGKGGPNVSFGTSGHFVVSTVFTELGEEETICCKESPPRRRPIEWDSWSIFMVSMQSGYPKNARPSSAYA